MSSYFILIQPLITISATISIIIISIIIIITIIITTMQQTWILKTENTKMMRMDKISKLQLVEKKLQLVFWKQNGLVCFPLRWNNIYPKINTG